MPEEPEDEGASEGLFSAAFHERTPAIEGYRIRSLLGAGGHSTVYLAEDEDGREVALKRWRAEWAPEVQRRVEREAAALAEVDHPHVARFHGWTRDAGGASCLVMEAVRGRNLAEELRASGPLSAERALTLARPLLDALAHLGERGLVHRDVKPANVVLRASDGLPVLVDFSVVKRLDPSEHTELTQTGATIGTSAYMAPEQCAGDLGAISPRTDVYGFGALLFHALCGVPPWQGESGWERTQRNPWRQPYPTQPEPRAQVEAARLRVPAGLGRVVARCLEGDPGRRYSSARAVAQALARLERGGPPGVALLAGAALLSLCAFATWSSFDHSSSLAPIAGQNPSQEDPPVRSTPTAALVTTALTLALSPTPTQAGEPSASEPSPTPSPTSQPSPSPSPASQPGEEPTPAATPKPTKLRLGYQRYRVREQTLTALASGQPGREDGGEAYRASLRSVRAELARRRFDLAKLAHGRLVDAAGRLPHPSRPGTLYLDVFSKEKQHAVVALEGCRVEGGEWRPTRLRYLEQAPPSYAQALARAKQLPAFRYLDTKPYTCGNQSFEIARFLHPKTGLTFHLVPSGVFLMGDVTTGWGSDFSQPAHLVSVGALLVSSTECTEAAWQTILGARAVDDWGKKGGRLPVSGIEWREAQAFCQKAGLRLPSESEWEYSCRAGSNTRLYYGGDPARIKDYAVVDQYERDPVGTRLPNAFGLYNMHGNVSEYCQDAFRQGYEGHPRDGSARRRADVRDYRVLRGWVYQPMGVRLAAERGSAWRNGVGEGRADSIGFRPVASLWPEDE